MGNDEGITEVDGCFGALDELIERMKSAKPGDRSDIDRRFAIVITELEKVEAYFAYFIINANS